KRRQSNMHDKIFTPQQMSLSNAKVIYKKRSRAPLIFILVLLATISSVNFTQFSFQVLLTQINQFFFIIGDMIPPDWSYMPKIWQSLMDSLIMIFLRSLIVAWPALLVAVLSSSIITRNKVVVSFFKFLLSLIRTLPTLVSALIATFVFGLGPTAGTVAILLFTLSYVGKLLYEAIENVDMGSFEAMESLG